MGIDIGRLLTMHAAWKLDRGEFARTEISMAKIVVADVLQQAVDTALQLSDARDCSKDTVLEGFIATRGKRASSTARRRCTRWFSHAF